MSVVRRISNRPKNACCASACGTWRTRTAPRCCFAARPIRFRRKDSKRWCPTTGSAAPFARKSSNSSKKKKCRTVCIFIGNHVLNLLNNVSRATRNSRLFNVTFLSAEEKKNSQLVNILRR